MKFKEMLEEMIVAAEKEINAVEKLLEAKRELVKTFTRFVEILEDEAE